MPKPTPASQRTLEPTSERDDRERDYSPSSCIGGNYRPFIEAYAQCSAQARIDAEALGGRWQRLPHGAAASQAIELCVPPQAAAHAPVPTLVFIHGGYWQELSAADSLFAAAACIGRGIAFAALDYTLAPAIRVGGIVAECREAFDALKAQAPLLGLDASRFVVAGSSAGAHLAAMLCLDDVPARPAAAVLVSGIYDLEPLIGTSINDALGLDAAEARSLSPLFASKQGFPPAVVCWGEIETGAFKTQSRALADALERSGVACTRFEVAGRNHFDVILELMRPDSPLGAATLRLLTSAS